MGRAHRTDAQLAMRKLQAIGAALMLAAALAVAFVLYRWLSEPSTSFSDVWAHHVDATNQ